MEHFICRIVSLFSIACLHHPSKSSKTLSYFLSSRTSPDINSVLTHTDRLILHCDLLDSRGKTKASRSLNMPAKWVNLHVWAEFYSRPSGVGAGNLLSDHLLMRLLQTHKREYWSQIDASSAGKWGGVYCMYCVVCILLCVLDGVMYTVTGTMRGSQIEGKWHHISSSKISL